MCGSLGALRALFGSCLFAVAAALPSHASEPFTPGNVLVSIETCCYWEGFAEYTRDGTELRRVTVPPAPPWKTPGDARDLAVDDEGRVAVFNSRSPEFLSTYDPALDSWHHTTPPDQWSQPRIISLGGIAALGDRVFATDAWDYGKDPKYGMLVYDRSEDRWQRFAQDISPCDLNLGLDGLLYAVHPSHTPSGDFVDVYDPETLAFLRRLDLASEIGWPADNRTVAVDADGNLYVGTWNGWIHRFDATGRLVASAQPPCPTPCRILDIDIAPTGELVFATRHGLVLFTDTELSYFRGFRAYPGLHPFVAWVPEPTLAVEIGIRPEALSVRGSGLVRVTLFGSDELDFDGAAPERLLLGPGRATPLERPRARPRDVEGDGHTDWIVWFRTDALDLRGGESELCLSGSTGTGRRLEGCSDVRIVGSR